ncbi:serine aminopeptidase domain-containing protein [Massilia sp. Leaf139]|uniref:alpha/beta hydrolase family protein n=1 Tax=Massilia sp. Leaf139 TaxID=1736272 RepID=UPI0006F94DC1|nr:alpha/beta hydrolase [Massilia sp. Leaf139]KQQ96548.1 alpha/beta hydrolase [Massilia sp. Leaf139]
MTPESHAIPTADGASLAATLYVASAPKALVLIHPATAVTQTFYEHFARYLAGIGLTALTYDYRGTGASRGRSLSGEAVTMAGWMLEDVPAVTRWALERFPDLPLLAVGHSVGGHALVLSGDRNAVRAAVLVACHAGITRTIRGRAEQARVWCVMRVLAPLLCALNGYMPGRRIGLGEDLPRGVMLQWSRWTTLPRYFYDDPALAAEARAARLRMPLLALGFDDDPWANPHAMDILLAPVTGAPVERRQFAPRTLGLGGIGHMGFFRKRCGPALWPAVGDWLLAQAAREEG